MLKRRVFEKKTVLMAFLFFILLFLNVPVAKSEEYPVRPIRIIVPYSPGGVNDVTCRSMVDPMSKVLGQPVIVENKPGGGASLGYTMVAKSKPDGYTLGTFAFGSLLMNYLSYDVGYNPTRSFTFIGGINRYAEAFVVRADAPWKTWIEFVEYSKQHPDEVRVGFSGTRSSNAVAGKWIAKRLGLNWKQVTFPGEAEAITALLGGHVDAFPGGGAVNMVVKDGRARMLLALTVDPIPGFPEVPTFKKVFGKETFNAAGYMGPSGISEPILKKLEKAVYEGTKDPGFLKATESMSMTPMWKSSKDITQQVDTVLGSFEEFLKDLGLLKK